MPCLRGGGGGCKVYKVSGSSKVETLNMEDEERVGERVTVSPCRSTEET